MKVIFLQDVPRIGKRFDVKEVNDGYARNFLFPRKLAELATKEKINQLEIKKNNIIAEKAIQKELLFKNLSDLGDKVVHLKVRADDKGHLFSGIHKKEIIFALKNEHHIEMDEDLLDLEKPIKMLGEYLIKIKLSLSENKGKIQDYFLKVNLERE